MSKKKRFKSDKITAANSFAGWTNTPYKEELSSPATLLKSFLATGYITLQQPLLSSLWKESGLIRRCIQSPIKDAMSKGFDIESDQLSQSDIEKVKSFYEEKDFSQKIQNAMEWGALYGGAALIINAEDHDIEQRIYSINKSEDFDLEPVDRWQLSFFANQYDYILGDAKGYSIDFADFVYLMGGSDKININNLILAKGDNMPYYIRQNLQGWGISAVEHIVRDLNNHTKTRNVLYEILDEAKIDIYSLAGLNENFGKNREMIERRIDYVNSMKNYKNAVLIDKDDIYTSKSLAFSGLSEVANENRIDIATTMGKPAVKLFGVSPSGFSSGEEEFKQYYEDVENDQRKKLAKIERKVINLIMQHLWGFVPEYKLTYKPLRTLSESELETIKNTKTLRYLSMLHSPSQAFDPSEIVELMRKEGLL